MDSMIPLSVFSSTEFCVTVLVIAAAVIAYAAMPAQKGTAREYLLGGELREMSRQCPPSIELCCLDSGAVRLVRYGVEGVAPDGAVSIAVTVTGFDILVKERLVAGREDPVPLTASFTFDFLGHERYHLRYVSEQLSLGCSLTVNNRPGITVIRPLVQ